MKDFNNGWDIVLSTYQKFIRGAKGRARIKKYIKGKFGLLILDEVHLANAPAFSVFAASLDPKYQLGLTATPNRKDGMEKVVEAVVGPVRVAGKSVGMKPKVEVHDTKLAPTRDWSGMGAFTKAVSWTAENKERNKMLVRQVFKDLREDKRHNIIIPIERRNQARVLVNMINKQAEINCKKRNETWPDVLARAYIGGVDKPKVISDMKNGKGTRVLVAMRKMCKLGLDIEALTHMYIQTPINNAPDFYQLTQRICTFYPNKPQPILRIYVDDIGISKGCFASSWWNGVIALRYYFDRVTAEKAALIINNRNKTKNDNFKRNIFADRFRGGGGFRKSSKPEIKKPSW
mgnify:FL=1